MQGSRGPGRFLWMPPSPRVLSSLSGAPLGPAQGGELRWDRDEHQLFPRLQQRAAQGLSFTQRPFVCWFLLSPLGSDWFLSGIISRM